MPLQLMFLFFAFSILTITTTIFTAVVISNARGYSADQLVEKHPWIVGSVQIGLVGGILAVLYAFLYAFLTFVGVIVQWMV
jgi:hypothetical protein